jgi:hypothetical protein
MITRQLIGCFVVGLVLICRLAPGADAQNELPLAEEVAKPAKKPVIDVWYGSQQSFGTIGSPIPYVNIVGRVSSSSGVADLSYSLNGSVELPLSIGPDGARLVDPGDFNVELELLDLFDGLNDLVIHAVDNEGNESMVQVEVSYTSGTVWPEDYTIDWSTVTAIQDVAQVLDGLWELSPEGVRPLQTGYDRLVAIGDRLWENYEVTVPITVLAIDPRAYVSRRVGAVVGVLLRWPGHGDWEGYQPRSRWWPHGAIGLLRWRGTEAEPTTNIEIFGAQKAPWVLQNKPREVAVGTTYIYKMRAQTLRGPDDEFLGTQYRLKIWEQGQREPKQWDLTASDGDDDVQFGSLLLLSHYVDCVFGNVTVVPLTAVPRHAAVKAMVHKTR